uniref:HpcH/HpaI aldolase/citrate lyase family protein n=1 Tax=Escherichia coli TaxID=562 RepID=UPI001FCE3EEC
EKRVFLVILFTSFSGSLVSRIPGAVQAVFKSQGAMCEPATHRRWAAGILDRARFYGLQNEQSADGIRLLTVTQHH